jgi:hypothetical protein
MHRGREDQADGLLAVRELPATLRRTNFAQRVARKVRTARDQEGQRKSPLTIPPGATGIVTRPISAGPASIGCRGSTRTV